MRALVRDQNLQLEMKTMEAPAVLSSDDVKIKVAYATFCRDDMLVSKDALDVFGGFGVVGHEASGTIVESGDLARQMGYLPGFRVSIMPFLSCGSCPRCLARQPQYCPEGRISNGVIAEYVVRKYRQLIKMPDGLSFKQGSLMEPVGDVLEALGKLRLNFHSEVLIIGGGFIGQIFLRLMRLRGVHRVAVIEPIESRRRLALSHGADATYGPTDPSLQVKLLEQTDFRGFDVVIDTSADVEMPELVFPCLARGGTLLLFAYSDTQSRLSFPSLNAYASNTQILWSCFCGLEAMEQAAGLISRLNLDSLITAEYTLEKSVEAYTRYLGTDEIKIGIKIEP